MEIKCESKNCYYRKNGECTLDEITISESGFCLEGATSVCDEAVRLAKEEGYESIYELFRNVKLD